MIIVYLFANKVSHARWSNSPQLVYEQICSYIFVIRLVSRAKTSKFLYLCKAETQVQIARE